ncbi:MULTISPECIES: TetR/AcrR family transcriptional regulator [unclassified Rathayibacter]|uniref:TetR/AcrR family transcriptional regulator n=1 Tax=unclassified Rathayibacter TaxID=2609250 RepID=UPI001FB3F85D|nr:MULTISPECIES: TetR/AcrR family transcriptional regulator [unclassified Rathayibacter]MCJ1673368.1 TetR/AcrR family transcriptional regulator [Rathayibacter sp. VKM Ac-2929]MCJ1682883.1 TetR/AcrR family transcriptional regulator [Rathayibacter sp. VKM Ac-2928]
MSRWAPDAALRLERAAMELFTEHGYSATTVPSIAERAGLTTRTFFRHFADKRDVLFLREREFPEVVARLLAGAPAGLDPLGLLMHGLETVAAGDLEGWRGEIAARRAVVLSEPALRERELLKSAVLTDAMRDALVERSVPAEDAALAARTAAVLFDASLEQWLGERDSTLVVVLHEQCLRLRRLVSAAEQAGSPE